MLELVKQAEIEIESFWVRCCNPNGRNNDKFYT